MGGFFRILPTNVSAFHTGLHGFYGVEYGRDFVPSMDAYDRAVSWNLNTALRHHAGKKGSHTGFGLKCDEAGWVKIDTLLRYEYVWNNITHRPIEKLYWWNHQTRREEIDRDVARFRLSTLFKIMHHNVVDGRRVRVQVLAFEIMPQCTIHPRIRSHGQHSDPCSWFVVGANCRESPFGAHAYQQLVRGQTSNGVPVAPPHIWSSDDDAFELSRDFT